MSKIKVTGLKLETKNGKKIELTLAEAKELHEELDELFGFKERIEYRYSYPSLRQPYVWYNVTAPNWGTITTTANNNVEVNSNVTQMKLSYLSEIRL